MKNNYAFVSSIKKTFKPGLRIKLEYMDDPFPVPAGTFGTVDYVDDSGQIQMKWDNGSSLALIHGRDSFQIISDDCKNKFVIKGSIKNKVVYYQSTSKQQIFGSEWDVPNFVESIDEATLFDSSEIAEDVCSNIDFSDFKIYPVCPICGEDYAEPPAISRKDNKSKICSKCGTGEALLSFIEYLQKKGTTHQ